MRRRLLACGARPINTVVDITNYVLLESGQPLHAFDFDRLADGTILVRRARAQEPITTLDGERRLLPEGVLVIADARQAVAVAGIMGGLGSEVTAATRTILLESAWFEPTTVRRTARALGLSSESSYRFERGVDPVGGEAASVRAAALIGKLAGGQEAVVRDVGRTPPPRTVISLHAGHASRWLGLRVEPPTIRSTLARLSCRVASSGDAPVLRVTPPSARQDLRQAADLYEELARAIGYGRIPSTLPLARMAPARTEPSERYQRVQELRRLCASVGVVETVTWSLVSEAELTRLGESKDQVTRLVNPISHDHAVLRPSLLAGAIQTLRRNITQGASGVRVFELGHVVREGAERLQLGLALSGLWQRDWQVARPCDFFRLKGLVEALLRRWCGRRPQWRPAQPPWAEAGHAAEVSVEGRRLGVAGQIARPILEEVDVEPAAWFAELSVDALLDTRRTIERVRPPATLPPAKRDLSLIVRADQPFEVIERTIRDVGASLAGRVELIDRYTGTPVPEGRISLTFSIEYRDPSRTLTAEEVDGLHRRIAQALVDRFGATLR